MVLPCLTFAFSLRYIRYMVVVCSVASNYSVVLAFRVRLLAFFEVLLDMHMRAVGARGRQVAFVRLVVVYGVRDCGTLVGRIVWLSVRRSFDEL